MKLLTKTHMSQRRLMEILRVIESANTPVGARAISDTLCNRGYDLGERAVRYNLKILDELGFTKKKGYSGRVITPLGSRAVSYTHLDVYKRQEFLWASRIRTNRRGSRRDR